MAQSTDFIGFKFNGRHSSEFNIYSVSNGSRYQDILVPSPIDYAEQIPGGVGQYYFGSDEDVRNFSLNIAFDNLTEERLRELRQWLSPQTTGELIFDERPYKRYTAKISNSPNISFICFDEYDKKTNKSYRVYRGEGEVNFICYYPYGITGIITNPLTGTEENRKELKWWRDEQTEYSNVEEWAESSGLQHDLYLTDKNKGYDHYIPLNAPYTGRGMYLYNPGDKETDFILSFTKPSNMNITFSITGNRMFTLRLRRENEDVELYGAVGKIEKEIAGLSGGTITIDTKKNLITYTNTNIKNGYVNEPIYFALKSGQLFKIPLGESALSISSASSTSTVLSNVKIRYDYLYY